MPLRRPRSSSARPTESTPRSPTTFSSRPCSFSFEIRFPCIGMSPRSYPILIMITSLLRHTRQPSLFRVDPNCAQTLLAHLSGGHLKKLHEVVFPDLHSSASAEVTPI